MNDDDIVKDFLVESRENLDRLDRDLVELEKNPHDRAALAGVFRTIHTIKGTCGFLGFAKLEKVAHVGENLLSRLRDGQLTLNPERTTALLGMVDAIRQMLKEIASTGQDGEVDYPELRETLARLLTPVAGDPSGLSPPKPSPATASSSTPPSPTEMVLPRKLESLAASSSPPQKPDLAPAPPAAAPKEPPARRKTEAHHKPAPGTIGGLLVERGQVDAAHMAIALTLQEQGDRRQLGEILLSLGFAKPEDIAAAQQLLETKQHEAVSESIRVGVNLLDKLMTLAGELVLARNQLLQVSNTIEDASLLAVSQRMNLIATELQEQVMKTRMQPIGNIWGQFPRTVRDVALALGKEVAIEMEGKETELDKTIIEAIKDPLTHLVRNSVDHGIELPDDRVLAGKPRAGRLVLRAFHEGGQVIIEISDDGAGLNANRIRMKALERGIITGEQATRFSEGELFNLVFLPGFSTAEKITNVSGRGVGMDVVKTNIERVGGVVDIQSTAAHGTTVRVKIPLTLAIIPALVVTCSGDRYAIPQVNLLELVRFDQEAAIGGIEMVHGAPVCRLRGRLLPLVYLQQELKLLPGAAPAGDGAVNIVVLQAEDRQFGLVVDEIIDTEEIVVKPLSKQIKSAKTFAGGSIMGDGKVALILDVVGLAQHAGVISATRDRALAGKAATTDTQAAAKQAFLLFAGPGDSRMAVPLDALARLEEFPVAQVEMTGKQWVTQYRGQILPLIRLEAALEERRQRLKLLRALPAIDSAPLQVLVLNHDARSFGLVVDQILDIVEDLAAVRTPATRPSVLYSVVIGDRVTELLDIPAILRTSEGIVAQPNSAARSAEAAN